MTEPDTCNPLLRIKLLQVKTQNLQVQNILAMSKQVYSYKAQHIANFVRVLK